MAWKVIEWGDVPPGTAHTIDYPCQHCHTEAPMPVIGFALAMTPGGRIVFDGPGAIPLTVRCTSCRREFTTDVRQTV